jgi:hypothetical protein
MFGFLKDAFSGAGFESWEGHRLFWLRTFMVSLGVLLIKPRPISSDSFPVHPSSYNSTLQSTATDSVVTLNGISLFMLTKTQVPFQVKTMVTQLLKTNQTGQHKIMLQNNRHMLKQMVMSWVTAICLTFFEQIFIIQKHMAPRLQHSNKCLLGRGQTMETGNHISKNFYQAEMNTWDWTEQRKLGKRQRDCNTTRKRLRSWTHRQMSKPVFLELRCSAVF